MLRRHSNTNGAQIFAFAICAATVEFRKKAPSPMRTCIATLGASTSGRFISPVGSTLATSLQVSVRVEDGSAMPMWLQPDGQGQVSGEDGFRRGSHFWSLGVGARRKRNKQPSTTSEGASIIHRPRRSAKVFALRRIKRRAELLAN
mmetsp:Transcript_3792/g.8269  ORF Transcript_3792/g.8269 Transcript_3792/m.8269 type:complete len:146 (-) Transcript_3792:401-838(-)